MKIEYSGQFKRDLKRAKKRGKKMGKLKVLMEKIIEGNPLDPRYSDHPLTGKWQGCRDSHIEPD